VAIEETFRREFQTRVEEAIDAESARFLMAHLPPIPWPDVATKQDLNGVEHKVELLRSDMNAGFTAIDQRMDARLANQRADLTLLIANQTRTMIIALITAFVAIASLALFR